MSTKNILVTFLLFSLNLFAQIAIEWNDLSDVKFEEDQQTKKWQVTYGDKPKELSNQQIVLSGYIIPLDLTKNTYVLSSLSFANCYFCGGAGLETVIELSLEDKKLKFKTDEYKKIQGKLRLNANDANHLIYILDNTQVLN